MTTMAERPLDVVADAGGLLQGVTSITVTYNSKATIGRMIMSLVGQVDEVIVVDNASSDGTCEIVRAFGPTVHLIQAGNNVGFAAAVNLGLANRKFADSILVNPDVVAPPRAVAGLVGASRASGDRFITVPNLVYPDGTRQESVRTFPTLTCLLARRTRLGKTSAGQRVLDRHLRCGSDQGDAFVDWAIGAVMYVPSAVLRKVGRMDDGFFLYCEDVDWCLRAWRTGSGVLQAADVVFEHGYARSSERTLDFRNRATRLHWRSMFHLMRKYPYLLIGVPRGPVPDGRQ